LDVLAEADLDVAEGASFSIRARLFEADEYDRHGIFSDCAITSAPADQ
jgi:hypothetical protein